MDNLNSWEHHDGGYIIISLVVSFFFVLIVCRNYSYIITNFIIFSIITVLLFFLLKYRRYILELEKTKRKNDKSKEYNKWEISDGIYVVTSLVIVFAFVLVFMHKYDSISTKFILFSVLTVLLFFLLKYRNYIIHFDKKRIEHENTESEVKDKPILINEESKITEEFIEDNYL